MLFGSITAQTLTADECTTPKNESGVCIYLTSCPVLLTVLSHRIKTKSVDDYNLLKNSHCGFEGRTTKVCCPLDETSPDSSLSLGEVIDEEVPSNEGRNSRSTLECGKIGINRDKIVGGTPAQLGSWPWIAALGYQDVNRDGDLRNDPLSWWCGGALITDRHVVTAAHCVKNNRVNSKLVAVRLGELDMNPDVADGATPVDIPIERTFVHSKYSTFDNTNDIALLKLQYPVTFSKFIQPICLLSASELNNINLAKTMPYVAGWGSTKSHQNDERKAPAVTSLMEVQVPIVNSTECRENYKNYRNVIDDRVICAGYAKGGKDSCRGDSGGPLMWPKKEQYFLMGVVSYGTKVCGQPNSPGVYTSVPSYLDWIDEKIQAS